MQFKVTGQHRDTGAKQILEFEAESRAAAERKGIQSGMRVTRVEDVSGGEADHTAITPGGSMRGRGSGGRWFRLIVLIVAAIVAYWIWKRGLQLPHLR